MSINLYIFNILLQAVFLSPLYCILIVLHLEYSSINIGQINTNENNLVILKNDVFLYKS